MDGEEQKVCPNCKREIPAVNFTIHTVHCARNIKMCPVCKEPVPQSELEEHHQKFHKPLPCKQCGEKVCGTDLEDHIRDSCGHTIKPCRYCSLELPRRSLDAHESYCGVRTEQCPECREYVMIKYRQLHQDSNHGFLRLDDDPVPQPKKDPPKLINAPKAANIPKPTVSPLANIRPIPDLRPINTNHSNGPRTEIRYFEPSASSSNNTPGVSRPLEKDTIKVNTNVDAPSVSRTENGQTTVPSVFHPPNSNVSNSNNVKRTKVPQSSGVMAAGGKVAKDLPGSHGAVKKRPAPPPPRRAPPPDPKRDLAYQSAIQRHDNEQKKRDEQNAYNLANGLPPVLSPAAKLEKLRKMDALQNRETEPVDYKTRLQGRVWMDRLNVPIGNVLGSSDTEQNNGYLEAERRKKANPGRPQSRTLEMDEEEIRHGLKNVKPMTTEQFMDRFKELQLRKERDERSERTGDRFSEIKSSLRELRRGLNEVTAPYNSSNSSSATNGERRRRHRSPRMSPSPTHDDAVVIPCEFCGTPIPAHDLVLHQTGCRPDLAQRRPRRSPSPRQYKEPVIPCEFCAKSLPVYLINEHQERCGRESNQVYPD